MGLDEVFVSQRILLGIFTGRGTNISTFCFLHDTLPRLAYYICGYLWCLNRRLQA